MPETIRRLFVRSTVVDRTLRRFALALVVAFGLVGVVGYAEALDQETLAGPAVELVDDFSCPKGFPFPVEVDKSNSKEDVNGDGIVCSDGGEAPQFVDNGAGEVEPGGCPESSPFPVEVDKTNIKADLNLDGIVCSDGGEEPRFVDNDVVENDAKAVNGHGNFFDIGKEPPKEIIEEGKEPKGLDISFSFHAMSIKVGERGGPNARGEFEYHNQTGQGPDLTVHGEVLCLSTRGNAASLVGIVTRSNDIGLEVGTFVFWKSHDNGEGANDQPDTVSRLSPIRGSHNSCRRDETPKLNELPIVSGNIQVH